jgi:hypothetical protein
MNIRLSDHPVRLELRAFRPGTGNSAIVHSTEHDTYRYLKTHLHQPSALAELRQLLAARGARPMASDDDVLHEAAAGIMMEKLFLIQPQQSTAVGVTADAATRETPVEAYKRPAVRPPPPLPPPGKPAMKEAPPPEPELTALLEQDVQAAGLEQAAAGAMPFCAVCDRAQGTGAP